MESTLWLQAQIRGGEQTNGFVERKEPKERQLTAERVEQHS